jgi:hypothetical protein
MTWLIYSLVCFGLAYVLGWSEITLGFRKALGKYGGVIGWLIKLIECPACLGFWTGVLCTVLLGIYLPIFTGRFVGPLALGLFTSATNLGLAKLVRLDE